MGKYLLRHQDLLPMLFLRQRNREWNFGIRIILLIILSHQMLNPVNKKMIPYEFVKGADVI